MKLLAFVLLFGLASAAVCTLRGDPHIRTFRGQKYNHYKTGWYLAAQGKGFRVTVLQSRSKTWKKRSVIKTIRVQTKGRKVSIFKASRTKACSKKGKTFRIPGGKVSVKTSCRKHAKDHHLNVRIALKSTKGVKGSCAVKVSKKKVLSLKHVFNKARRCGVSKKRLFKAFAGCAKRGRGKRGCLLDYINGRCRKCRIRCAQGFTLSKKHFCKCVRKRSRYRGQKCAREHSKNGGNICKCDGVVSYGAKTKFFKKHVVGKITCNNANFGDPIRGTVKDCFCKAKKKRRRCNRNCKKRRRQMRRAIHRFRRARRRRRRARRRRNGRKVCTLRGDPHIRTFRGQKYNHYKTGWYLAAQGKGFRVTVLQSRSKTWKKRSVIKTIRVQTKGRKVSIFKASRTKACSKKGKTFRIPGGKVSVKTSCRKHAKDHHLNVRIALKSTKGVKGSCAVKVSKKKVLSLKHVFNKARRCGVSKKRLFKAFAGCAKRGRGKRGCLLDYINGRCRKCRIRCGKGFTLSKKHFCKCVRKRSRCRRKCPKGQKLSKKHTCKCVDKKPIRIGKRAKPTAKPTTDK